MCDACLEINEEILVNKAKILQFDPTRTLTLRKRFVADMEKRFKALSRLIAISIVNNDCFGLKESSNNLLLQSAVSPNEFKFDKNPAKINKFMDWLKQQEKDGVLELINRPGVFQADDKPWINTYIDTAYQRGIRRGREELRNQGVEIPDFGDKQLRDPIMVAFNQPVHAERVAMIYTRAFNDLKGITNAMDTQISRVLAQGLAEGRGPREIARSLVDRVDAIGRARARTLARTEVIRAHHSANVQEYRNAGIQGVSVRVEWSTAGFKVCPVCAALQGKKFSLDEIEYMIPKHPNCIDGDSVVLAPDAAALMQTMYSGPVIKIFMTDGAKLTVTPNHMLMTPHGLVMARFLHDGDDLLYCPEAQGKSISGPNDDGEPASIDEVVKAFTESSGSPAASMPVSAIDFHGDGVLCEGDVHVIRADSFLRDGFNTKMGEIFKGFELNGRAVFDILFADGTFAEFFKRAFFPPDGIMGVTREQLAFLRGGLLHSQKHGFTSVPGSNSQLFEAPGDHTPAHPNPFGHGLDRQAFIDHLQDCFGVDAMTVAGTSFPEGQASFDKVGFDGIALNSPNEGGQAVKGFSSHVTRMQIKNVEIVHVDDLPMFDVTTTSTGYIVNGILSSNCRCVAIPIVD